MLFENLPEKTMSRKPKIEFVIKALMAKEDEVFKMLPIRSERELSAESVRLLVYVVSKLTSYHL